MLYVQDPVCGGLIAWEDAKAILPFDGRLYYFCSRLCRCRFLEDPRSFLSEEKAEGKRVDSGVPEFYGKGGG